MGEYENGVYHLPGKSSSLLNCAIIASRSLRITLLRRNLLCSRFIQTWVLNTYKAANKSIHTKEKLKWPTDQHATIRQVLVSTGTMYDCQVIAADRL